MLGVAVAAITSCTNDEVLEMNPQTTISFDGFVNKGTRAVTEVTKTDLTDFHVFGGYWSGDPVAYTAVFAGESVKDNVATDKVWTENTYDFAAYSKNGAEGAIPGAAFNASSKKLTLPGYLVSDSEDLVAAITPNVTKNTASGNVQLDFKHLLSRVKFTVSNGDPKYKMVVKTVQMTGIKTTGDCVFDGTTADWTLSGSTSTLDFFKAATINAGAAAVEMDEHFVLPAQDLSAITASIVVQFLDVATDQPVSTKEYNNVPLKTSAVTAWANGVIYNYTVSVKATTSNITFVVDTVDGWTTETQEQIKD